MILEEWLAERRADYRGRKAYEVVSGGAAPERADALRGVIEAAAEALDDETALEAVELFPAWAAGTAYGVGDRVRYFTTDAEETDEEPGPRLYRCVQAHTAQADWEPAAAPALWARVDDPAEAWPEWRQPTGAQDAYAAGAQVSHNGAHWVSDVDNNVWEPGVYGWYEA